MRYYPEQSIFFHHIPRTGGTYVENVLDRLGFRWQHSGWTCRSYKVRSDRSHSLIGHYVRSKTVPKIERSFTFVRHPVDYYEAIHRFLTYKGEQREVMQTSWHPLFHAIRLYDPDLETWARRMMREQGNWVTRLYESFVGPDGGEFVDYVGRTETLVNDLDVLLREFFGITKHLPTRRVYSVGKQTKMNIVLRTLISNVEMVGIRRFYGIQCKRRYGWLEDKPISERFECDIS